MNYQKLNSKIVEFITGGQEGVLHIDKDVEDIEWHAVVNMPQEEQLKEIVIEKGNKNYKIIDGNLIDIEKKVLRLSPDGCEIPKSEEVKKLGYHCFIKNERLKNVVIPGNIEKITTGAFALSKVESIVVPESVNCIGPMAFGFCSELKEVVILGKDTEIHETCFCRILPDGTKLPEMFAKFNKNNIVVKAPLNSIAEKCAKFNKIEFMAL